MCNKNACASAPLKLILFGEHAVVYGALGIATAIAIRITCSAMPRTDDKLCLISENNKKITHYDEVLDRAQEVDHLLQHNQQEKLQEVLNANFFAPIEYVAAKVRKQYGVGGVEANITSPCTPTQGMGTSSASAAAFVAALGGIYELKLNPHRVSELVYQADMLSHGITPSGIDNNIVSFGGFLAFQKDVKIEPIKVQENIRLVVALAGKRPQTGVQVEKLRQALEKNSLLKNNITRIHEISERAFRIFTSGHMDLSELGSLATENHMMLRELGVSSPELNKLVETAVDSGAYGAKMSGAGGGGVMFAIVDDDRSEHVFETLSAMSKSVWIMETGAKGVYLEELSGSLTDEA